MTRLSLIPPDSRAVVSSLPRAHSLAKRMIAMGLTPGAEVRVIRNRGRGPLIVEVRGARLALGWGQAAWVEVEPLDGVDYAEPPSPAESGGTACLVCAGEPAEEN